MTPGSMSTNNPNRHKLYRTVFEEGRHRFSGDQAALDAIDERISSTKKLEIYHSFYAAVMGTRVSDAMHILFQHPWVLFEFLTRVTQQIPFYIHRMAHGGTKRVSR